MKYTLKYLKNSIVSLKKDLKLYQHYHSLIESNSGEQHGLSIKQAKKIIEGIQKALNEHESELETIENINA